MKQGFLPVLSVVFAILFSPCSHANGVDRGGGDPYEQELRTLGHQVVEQINLWRALPADAEISTSLFSLDLVAFEAAIASTRVISTDEPVLVMIDGKPTPREAANSRLEKTIWLNRPMWNQHAGDRISKLSIVMHEYLGIMDTDRDYQYSIAFRKRLEHEADTTQFRISLAEQLKDLAAALDDHFKERFEPALARYETMRTTDEFRRCLNRKLKKPQRLAACLDVTNMMVQASRLTPMTAENAQHLQASDAGNVLAFSLMKEQYRCNGSRKRAIGNRLVDWFRYRKWKPVCPKLDHLIETFETAPVIAGVARHIVTAQKFIAFADRQRTSQRREFAIRLHNRLVDEFVASSQSIHRDIQDLHASTDGACPGGLAEAVSCGIPHVLGAMSSRIAPTMQNKRQQLGLVSESALKDAAIYSE